ncbi:MAG: hypothetical protein V1876_00215, partial [Candidatus Peregrinibacteria bacterium]
MSLLHFLFGTSCPPLHPQGGEGWVRGEHGSGLPERRLLGFAEAPSQGKQKSSNEELQNTVTGLEAKSAEQKNKLDAAEKRIAELEKIVKDPQEAQKRQQAAQKEATVVVRRTVREDGKCNCMGREPEDVPIPEVQLAVENKRYCREQARCSARPACERYHVPSSRPVPREGQLRTRYSSDFGLYYEEYHSETGWQPNGRTAVSRFDMDVMKAQNKERRENLRSSNREGTQGGTLSRMDRLAIRNNPVYASRLETRHKCEELMGWAPGSLDVKPLGRGDTESYQRHLAFADKGPGSDWVETPGGGYFDRTRGGGRGGRRESPEVSLVSYRPRSGGYSESPDSTRPRGSSEDQYMGLLPSEKDAQKLSDQLAKDWGRLPPEERSYRTAELRSYAKEADRVASEARVGEPFIHPIYTKFFEVGPRIGMGDADRA